MKNIIYLPVFLFFTFACCSKSDLAEKECCSKIATSEKEANINQGFSELSVYNLNSEWTNSEGKKMTLSDLKGKVQVAAMIYTSCTFACPRIFADLKRIEDDVIKNNWSDDIRFLLVSIDPEVDTPEKLHETALENNFDLSRWTLLNGKQDDVLELAMVLGVKYKRSENGHYAHSNIITVLDQDGVVAFQQEGLGINVAPVVEEIGKIVK